MIENRIRLLSRRSYSELESKWQVPKKAKIEVSQGTELEKDAELLQDVASEGFFVSRSRYKEGN